MSENGEEHDEMFLLHQELEILRQKLSQSGQFGQELLTRIDRSNIESKQLKDEIEWLKKIDEEKSYEICQLKEDNMKLTLLTKNVPLPDTMEKNNSSMQKQLHELLEERWLYEKEKEHYDRKICELCNEISDLRRENLEYVTTVHRDNLRTMSGSSNVGSEGYFGTSSSAKENSHSMTNQLNNLLQQISELTELNESLKDQLNELKLERVAEERSDNRSRADSLVYNNFLREESNDNNSLPDVNVSLTSLAYKGREVIDEHELQESNSYISTQNRQNSSTFNFSAIDDEDKDMFMENDVLKNKVEELTRDLLYRDQLINQLQEDISVLRSQEISNCNCRRKLSLWSSGGSNIESNNTFADELLQSGVSISYLKHDEIFSERKRRSLSLSDTTKLPLLSSTTSPLKTPQSSLFTFQLDINDINDDVVEEEGKEIHRLEPSKIVQNGEPVSDRIIVDDLESTSKPMTDRQEKEVVRQSVVIHDDIDIESNDSDTIDTITFDDVHDEDDVESNSDDVMNLYGSVIDDSDSIEKTQIDHNNQSVSIPSHTYERNDSSLTAQLNDLQKRYERLKRLCMRLKQEILTSRCQVLTGGTSTCPSVDYSVDVSPTTTKSANKKKSSKQKYILWDCGIFC